MILVFGGTTEGRKAVEVLEEAYQQKSISWRTLLKMARCMEHGMTRVNLYDEMPADEQAEDIAYFCDFIPRYTTASTYMVQGVRPGENPLLTTGWTCISSPLATVTIPVWTAPATELPLCIRRNDEGHCLLVDWATVMKSYIWPLEYSDGQNYIRLGRLINRAGTGIMQQIQPVEDEIVRRGEKLQQQFFKKGKVDKEKLKNYYAWLDQYVAEEYQKIGSRHGLAIN